MTHSMEAPMTRTPNLTIPQTTRRIAVAAALLAFACGTPSSDTTSPDLRPSPSGGGSLAGTAWVVTEIRGEPPLGTEELTLVVGDSTAGGYSGCNSFGGTPHVTAGAFRLDEAVATLRACADARLMDQEADYLAILAQTSAWEIDGDVLRMVAEGGESLTFRASADDMQ
jgi:heat shock protein HslJ